MFSANSRAARTAHKRICRAAALLAAVLSSIPVHLAAQGTAIPDTADIVLLGGKVFTADTSRLWAEAVAIKGAHIIAIGASAEVERFAGPKTRRIPLNGRTVVPGFDDAHGHAGLPGARGVYLAVSPGPNGDPALALVLDSLAGAARRVPPGTWLKSSVGARVLDDPRATRFILDSVAPAHPVWLQGGTGHGLLLNTAAMRLTGVLEAADPLGGWLTRDHAGRPSGRLDEYAMLNVERLLAEAHGDSLLANAMKAYGEAGLRLGITSVQDMATQYGPDALRGAVFAGGNMRIRHRVIRLPNTNLPGGWRSDWQVAPEDPVRAALGPVIGVKWILDGTPIERLALMREPYADRPGWYGRANFQFDTLRAILRDALVRREQPVLHAVGDSTIALVIAAMRAEAPDSAWRLLRPRLEHADGLSRDQLEDIRSLGIIVVQNPAHLALPAELHARWGSERMSRVNLLRTLVEAGIPLAIGSDGPRSPALNIMFATLHPNVPAEALTREQAVVAYTRGSAQAAFAEHERGTLAVGMLADLVVLSHDVFTISPDMLPAVVSLLTIVGGVVLYEGSVS